MIAWHDSHSDDLIRHYIEVAASDPDGWGGMDPDDHRYNPDCHCNDCASEHGGAS